MTQDYVDSTYPPTHTYDVTTMQPTGVLKSRVDLIDKYFPDFFRGKKLLDVGCSKGWFSLSSGKQFQEIIALDSNEKDIALCNDLKLYGNTEFIHSSFRNFISMSDFDRVFLGNVAHYLFMAIRGWEWISKLSALTNDLVLIEGATNTKCRDMKNLIPKQLHKTFNRFMKEMNKHFTLEKKVATTSYTPDRYFMLFKKKPLLRVKKSDLPILLDYHSSAYLVFLTKISAWKFAVAKICLVDQPIWADRIRIRIAADSPISNGMIGEIHDKGKVVGWLENYSLRKKYSYFQGEKELFKRFCIHSIYLSKLGYVELDPATINFFKGSKKLFDKNCVFPLSRLKETSLDSFLFLLWQSYKTVSEEIVDKIMRALKTKDLAIVQSTYEEVLEQWA